MYKTLTRGDVVGTGIQTLVVEECGECGVLFALPNNLRRRALEDHTRYLWCPNGHSLVFKGKTEAQKLQERLDAERERSGRLAAERDQTAACLRATRGVVTRMKKRASAGVCPGCNRSFENLARHMASKHPDFTEGEHDA